MCLLSHHMPEVANFRFESPRQKCQPSHSDNVTPNLLYLSQDTRLHRVFAYKTPRYLDQHIPKMDIRLLHPSDIPHVQTTNITNLPENYFCKYYMYHQLSWPQLSYVAVDVSIHRLLISWKNHC